MKILIIDDDKYRHDKFKLNYKGHDLTHVQDAPSAIQALKSGMWDVVQIDHDLGVPGTMGAQDGATGYTVASWYEEQVKTEQDRAIIGRVVVHSMNPQGAARIYAAFKSAGVPVKLRPFDG